MKTDIEFKFALHEPGFFTAVALIMPDDSALRYEFIGEPKESSGLTAEEFKAALVGRRFPRAKSFEFYVAVKGVKLRATVPMPEWPSSTGYTVREGCVFTKLIL